MSATGTIVTVYQTPDSSQVCAVVLVAEGGNRGNVEYVGCVANDAAFQALSAANKKTALQTAVKAARDAAVAAASAVGGITGSVTL